MKEILKVKNLSKRYGERTVVDNLNLEVYEKDVFGFLGPNGAGKTTTIRMILNLISPNGGHIEINGINLHKDYKKAISNVAAIVEIPKFYEHLTAYDNVMLIKNFNKDIPKSRVYEVLEIVGLKGREKDKVKTYSLGMKQRLGIALTLINDPKLIILDEPTNGLDPQGIVEIRQLIKQLTEKHNKTVFVSSHLLHEVEMICNRVVIINKGKTIVKGNVKELINSDKDQIEVSSPHRERIREICSTIKNCEFKGFTENGVLLDIEKNSSGKIINALVNAGIEVNSVANKTKSLETFFIESIEGDKKVC